MANITRIKAKDKPAEKPTKKPEKKVKTAEKPVKKVEKKAEKPAEQPKKQMPKALRIITWPFRMILKPFFALGRYIKASWHELRQVRWPSRGATFKMTLAALLYAALFMVIIVLLDALFTWLFNLLLS